MGTPEFMSPEQISDPDSVDSRVDVYALGVIMYHMLGGVLPFRRTPLQSLLTQIVVDPPPPIERLGVPEGLQAILLKALAKNPADRFATMREMGMELERLSARIFSGADWDEAKDVPSFDSGSTSRPVPITRSGPVSGSVPRTGPISGPVSAPQLSPSGQTSVPVVSTTDPTMASRGGRGLLFVSLALALASVGGVAFLLLRPPHSTEPAPAAPAAQVAVAPPPAPPPAAQPGPVHLRVSSSTPQARVTLRGRTHLLPFAEDVKPGSTPEIVEMTAPGREGRRFWVTFDHPIALAAELPAGHGVLEATEEETVIALGGKSVDGDHAAAEDAPAAHHPGGHRRSSGGLTLAKATGPAEHASSHVPSEAPPEPKAVPSAPPPKVESPPPPKVAVTAATPKPDPMPSARRRSIPRRRSAAARPGLDPAKTQALVRSHLPEVQRCYERGKMDYPDIKGRVTLRISVSESGGVTSAMVESSSLGSSSVESCIVGVVKGWKFPAPVGGPAVISYPFNLR